MSAQTLHCNTTVPNFSAGHPPAMSVALGEVFTVETNDRFAGTLKGELPAPEAVAAMVGPVRVEGVAAGDMLAISVRDIAPRTGTAYLMASPGYGVLGERIERRARAVVVDAQGVHLDERTRFAYRPMIGKIGVAPAEGTRVGTDCAEHGGAISNTQLGPGATLLVRAQCAGALLCLEDVHANMGDGEATASAVEMAARVTLCCTRYEGGALPQPMILTADKAITLGHGDSLDAAAQTATDAMLELIMTRRQVDLTDAAMLVGAAVDVRLAFFGASPRKAYAAIARELVGM